MSSNATETAVGAAVLAVAIGFVLYAGQAIGGFETSSELKTVSAAFRSVDGVNVGTDVRLAGVKVGTVTDIELDPVTFRAITEFTVDGSLDIPDDSSAIVSSEGLLGGNFVEIVPGGSPFNIEDGGEFLDTQGAVSLISLLLKFVAGSE